MSIHPFIYTFISSFIALFPVVNPIGSAFIVNGYFEGIDDSQRKSAIKKIVFYCLIIAIGSLLAGHFVLLLFGLAIPVIQIGGGIIIAKTGIDWLLDSKSASKNSDHDTIKNMNMDDISGKLFYPLSFPLSMGPGTISVIITLMATASVKGNMILSGIHYLSIILAILILLTIFYLIMLHAPRITRRLGHSGNVVINKLIAFITFCIGIQIIVTGIAKVFHLTIL